MLFLMDVVLIITSNNPTLDFPSLVFAKNCDWIPINDSANLSLTLSWISGGKNEIYLLTVLAAELVWSVENTRCPVSAKLNTDSAVSLSRISPTKMMFGSSLIADLKAFANDRVSCQISLWEMIHFFGSKMNSIGSSIVIRFWLLVSLRWSSIATNDVDLPEPVGPVTRYNHFFADKIFFLMLSAISEKMSSSSFLAIALIFLITTPILPVLKKAFTL